MKILKAIGIALVSSLLLVTAGCGGSDDGQKASADQSTKKVLKYRVMPTATSDLFDAGVKPILEKKGYKLEAVNIKDSVQREMALEEGQIDFHVDAHQAWIDAINASKGTHLTTILKIPADPTGLYAGSKTSLDQVADGDTILVPNDASNLARSYQLLSRLGWITLDSSKDPNHVTAADIVSNPKHLNFQEMKGPTIASVRTDAAYIILRGSDAYNAKVPFNTALFAETEKDINDKNYKAICINEKNKDTQWAKDLIAAYKSQEFKDYMKANGSFWILPDYLR